MDQSAQYGQMDFNLPHDVVKLPSGGVFYKPKKDSLKVGYLTASDENILLSQNTPKEGLITHLLRHKIYEPGFDVKQLLDVDVQAILIFLRNTSFGPEYHFNVKDPATGINFETQILLDEINFIKPINEVNEEGLFETVLPNTKAKVSCKILSVSEINEIEESLKNYPTHMTAPVITKKLESHVVKLNGENDKSKISHFINKMPIADSKYLRKFIRDCEPQLDLNRTITAPSGEKVTLDVTFGVEFFRPFFGI
jgi:hypothetical protein